MTFTTQLYRLSMPANLLDLIRILEALQKEKISLVLDNLTIYNEADSQNYLYEIAPTNNQGHVEKFIRNLPHKYDWLHLLSVTPVVPLGSISRMPNLCKVMGKIRGNRIRIETFITLPYTPDDYRQCIVVPDDADSRERLEVALRRYFEQGSWPPNYAFETHVEPVISSIFYVDYDGHISEVTCTLANYLPKSEHIRGFAVSLIGRARIFEIAVAESAYSLLEQAKHDVQNSFAKTVSLETTPLFGVITPLRHHNQGALLELVHYLQKEDVPVLSLYSTLAPNAANLTLTCTNNPELTLQLLDGGD